MITKIQLLALASISLLAPMPAAAGNIELRIARRTRNTDTSFDLNCPVATMPAFIHFVWPHGKACDRDL
jgi:hypothetical protein